MTNKNSKLIISFDNLSVEKAKGLFSSTSLHIAAYSFGTSFLIRNGIKTLEPMSSKIMLDLRLCDSKVAVAQLMSSILEILNNKVAYITISPFAPVSTMLHVVKCASPLTSVLMATPSSVMIDDDIETLGYKKDEVGKITEKLLKGASNNGIVGCICKPHEVASIRKTMGKNFLIICSDIIALGSKDKMTGDGTPYDAIKNGADLIVVGSLITSHTAPGSICTMIEERLDAAQLTTK